MYKNIILTDFFPNDKFLIDSIFLNKFWAKDYFIVSNNLANVGQQL